MSIKTHRPWSALAPALRPHAGRWSRLGSMACLLVGIWVSGAAPALAADDPPGRVGRVVWIEGGAQLLRGDGGETLDHGRESLRNWPVTSGDELRVGDNSRAEIGIGSTRLRLGEMTQLLLRRVDDQRIELELRSGSLAVLLRSDEVARELSIETSAAHLLPLGAGLYRIDVPDAERGRPNLHAATAWRNGLRIDQPVGSYTLQPGQRAEIYPDGGWRLDTPQSDAFARWAMNNDDLPAPQAARDAPVPDEMTGAAELDRHGEWTRSADYGWVWYPRTVGVGWAPYRDGRWSWVSPWGWTWIDDAPWGFAPFHYGRWIWWHERWGWVPGDYTPRPVYAPALVVWNGAPGLSWSIGIGTGVAWYPLAPREVYVPPYASGPRHVRLVNQPHVNDGLLIRRVIDRPDDVLRSTPYRYQQFGGAVSIGAGRDGRPFRQAPWRGAVELPPRLRAPAAPPVVTRIQPPQPPQPEMRHHGNIDRDRSPAASPPPMQPNPQQQLMPAQPLAPPGPTGPAAQPGQLWRPQPGLAQPAAPVAPQQGASFPRFIPRDGERRPDGRAGLTPMAPATQAQQQPPQQPIPRAPLPGIDRAQREAPHDLGTVRQPTPQPAPAIQAAPPPAAIAPPPQRPEQRIAVPRAEPPRPPEVRQEQRRDIPPQRGDERQDGRRERWPPGREQ